MARRVTVPPGLLGSVCLPMPTQPGTHTPARPWFPVGPLPCKLLRGWLGLRSLSRQCSAVGLQHSKQLVSANKRVSESLSYKTQRLAGLQN